jgi:integrase
MPRARTGTVWYDEQRGCWAYKLTLNGGSRGPTIHIPTLTTRSPQARLRAREVAAEKSEIAGQKSLTREDFGLKPKHTAAPPADEDMAAWVRRWTAHRESRGLSTATECEGIWKRHVQPVVGAHVRHWTRDDFRRLSRALDDRVHAGELSWRTARNVWVVATKIAADAAGSKLDSIRCREDNPATGVQGPDRGADKAKQYLYPSEFLTFASCERAPLRWRRAVTLAIYLFVRDSELGALCWEGGDVDLVHGVLSVTRAARKGRVKSTKSGVSRRFAIEPELLPLLRAMHAGGGAQGPLVTLPVDHHADSLRRWLWKAGVRRPELHKGSATRKAITWHDLRATGITWMAVRGDDPLKIKQRAGHASFTTTEVYIREAEAVREGFGAVFPPLPSSLVSDAESSGESSGSGRNAQRNGAKSLLRGEDLNLRPSGYE